MEVILPQASFQLKPHFLIATNAPRIIRVNAKEDPVQVQGVEAPPHERPDGIGSVTAAPVLFRPNDDADLARAVAPVDRVITASADVFPDGASGAGGQRINGPCLGVFCRQVLFKPVLFLLQAQGAVLSQVKSDLWICEPADKSGQISPLNRSQANLRASYHGASSSIDSH